MKDKITTIKGGKKAASSPRSGVITISIPDLDSLDSPVQFEIDDTMSTPEAVFYLMTAVNMLTHAHATGGH